MAQTKEQRRQYYLTNRTKILKASREKYLANKEGSLLYQQQYRDKNRILINAKSKKKRHDRLLNAIELLGSKCNKCQQTFDPICYDFHHKNPSTKLFTISENMLVGENRFFEEVKKCVLLCANCHRLEHKEYINDNRTV